MEKATHTHADEMKEEITVYAFTIYTCPVSYLIVISSLELVHDSAALIFMSRWKYFLSFK